MRILVTVVPAYGLMLPIVPLVSAARAAGHDVVPQACDDEPVPGSRDEQIAVIEALIGLSLPSSHRRLLLERDGWEATYGGTFVRFYGAEEIRASYLQLLREGPSGLSGFVAFGTDGSRELIGYDRRVGASPVIMVDITATDWSSAKLQGVSFDGFLGRLRVGKGLDFATTYAGPPG